ncbi:hypothetical protein G7K_6480-t1 [Saitoella complicata NRRL Y-17804]|uniref:Uncharacterized protein n=1 Tax=Saitoella complicata (strain BCRC 22490 / CBS 7301 / JCM 7358 / NBRC 10748 / NRRL Y-17804) TaxID=698492 RepID=A0A0E9NRC3_SAICN|nr:hypothetical protein G7K_6480-t1 [Saitoella complicata NRRL Y-17804]
METHPKFYILLLEINSAALKYADNYTRIINFESSDPTSEEAANLARLRNEMEKYRGLIARTPPPSSRREPSKNTITPQPGRFRTWEWSNGPVSTEAPFTAFFDAMTTRVPMNCPIIRA